MTQITLPNQNVTGPNLWSQVENNDKAIRDVVNGDLDNGNIATNANINGNKLLAASVAATQLASGSVTEAKIASGAVTSDKLGSGAVTAGKVGSAAVGTAQIADGAITTDKLGSGAVTGAKIAANTIGSEKLVLTFDHTQLSANTGVSNNQWNQLLTINTGIAGIYLMMASGGVLTPGGCYIVLRAYVGGSGNPDANPGLLTPATSAAVPFSRQWIAATNNGFFGLDFYPLSGKGSVAAATSLTVIRIS
jgi:hypothetical protein